MARAGQSWGTPALTGLVVALTDQLEPLAVVRTAVEHVAAALGADTTALATVDRVLWSTGEGVVSDAAVLAIRRGDDGPHGATTALTAPCAAPPDAHLVVVRTGPDRFRREEVDLLTGMAGVLSLAVQARGTIDLTQPRQGSGDAALPDNARLLASLAERQVLLERLARIQRSISSRRPLHEVLDAIVAGAAELIGDDVVGLRLLDPLDETVMVLGSSLGVPDELAAGTRRLPVGQGVGGQAIVQNTLVHTSSYGEDDPLPGYAADGIHSAMGAPVRRGARAIGSLVVATRRRGRHYSTLEQEALTAFAEHVGLALNDATSVAALHAAVAEAEHQSRHDSLTGLPNRAMFLEQLHRAGAGTCGSLALLFIDLDDFKLVNDSLGHLVGDQLLSAVGRRIRASVRKPDVVARLGGDEFAVIMGGAAGGEARRVARHVLDALQAPFATGGHTVHVRASAGLVTTDGPFAQPTELLRDADVAMYRAKAEGKHRYVVFEPEMRDELQARSVLQEELRTALGSGELILHYQPVVDTGRRRVCSTEALLRWDHPRLGLVEPTAFVSLAEQAGLIVAIGSAVLRLACAQTAHWRRDPALSELTVSVNVSARQLREPTFVGDVRGALAVAGLPPEALTLEITESLLVSDVPTTVERLHALKALGVRIAVDDFGTGFSSLSYLARLPVDVLKVDRSFVAGIGAGAAGKLAWAVLALADSLGLATVAEGVETREQAAALVDHGCTTLQGFLHSGPVPAALLPATAARLLGASPWALDGPVSTPPVETACPPTDR